MDSLIKNKDMLIDFCKIKEEKIQNFKGGEGELDTRNFIDNDNKIMMSRLKPGASSGLHKHEGNCEIVYVVEGEATFIYDDKKEVVKAGQVHYCPDGHTHSMKNNTDKDLVYFAIVPQLQKQP